MVERENSKFSTLEKKRRGCTDSMKGLAVTKGKGWRRLGGVVGLRGLRGVMIGTRGVGGSWGRQCSTEKASSDSVASYYTDGQ